MSLKTEIDFEEEIGDCMHEFEDWYDYEALRFWMSKFAIDLAWLWVKKTADSISVLTGKVWNVSLSFKREDAL